MSDVINLGAERDRRNGPDAEFRMSDDFGRPMFKFLLSYDMDGGSWSTTVWAYSMDDAIARVEAMKVSLRCDGQIYSQLVI